MNSQLIPKNIPLTFADFFKLNLDVEDITAHFGYSFQAKNYALPRTAVLNSERLQDLKSRLEESLPYLSLTTEMARREFLIAPVLLELIHYVHTKIKVEFPLEVSDQLKGTVDYYLQTENSLLVIEAKNADLQKGFNQLAVELIALDQWLKNETSAIYGAVSMGNIWQFGILDRSNHHLSQDLNLYRVPADLEVLLQILVSMLGVVS